MNEKAAYLTIEAIISLLALTAIIASQNANNQVNLTELYQVQKQADLIRVWVISENLNQDEMISDVNSMFPEKKTAIEFEDNLIELNKQKKYSNSIALKGFYWKNNKLNEIKLTVFN